MRSSSLCALLSLALATTMAAVAPAQEPGPSPLPAADVAALRARIARLSTATIGSQVAAAATSAAPSAAPARRAESRATTGFLSPPLRPVRIANLRFVPLGAEDEAMSKRAVAQQVRQQAVDGGATAAAVPIAVLDGAFRALASDASELTLKAVALSAAPLRYAPQDRRFEGTIHVGVVDIGGRQAPRLAEPIVFQVIGPVTATPTLVNVGSTAPPYESVAIASDATAPTVDVRIFSRLANDAVTLSLPVQPALLVQISPREIQGWGLEKAEVQVSAIAFAAGGQRAVQLSWDRGTLEPDDLTLGSGGSAKATIRSASTGIAAVTASGAGFSAGSGTVRFVFPTRFLIAALVGGSVGGALRVFVRRRSTWPRTLAKLGLAVATGAIVFALFALGVNLTGFPLPAQGGELLVFVVVALGAYGGAGLLKPKAPPTS